MQRARYAMLQLSKISGVKCPAFSAAHFKEFVVNFDATGKTVDWIPKKANDAFESDFANQEITVDGPTEEGGGWLREKVITTKTTTVTGLKDFYTYALRADLPVMEMYSISDLIDDAHMQAVGFFSLDEHPSEGTIRQMRTPSGTLR